MKQKYLLKNIFLEKWLIIKRELESKCGRNLRGHLAYFPDTAVFHTA